MLMCDVSKNQSVSFGSNTRHVYKNGKLLYKNTTNFFRDDLNWEKFVDFLDFKYKDTEKVNIVNSACSDGAEPFSLVISLIENLKQKAAKFLPVKATDIDEHIINSAQNNPCNISDTELYTINKHTNSRIYDYFTPVRATNPNYDLALQAKEKLSSHIHFQQADIFKTLSNIPKQNNVLLCRNFWVYLTEQMRKTMIETMAQKLDHTSTLVIGELENGWKFNELLEQNGFRETFVRNVYEKKK